MTPWSCEHMAIELTSRYVKLGRSITMAHWFTCIACNLKTVYIETQLVLK